MGKNRPFWLLFLVFAALLFLVWGIDYHINQLPVIPNQRKIGVTYMTMNNDFYKHLHLEISRLADERGDQLIVRDPELDEEKQARQLDDFRQAKVETIVINPVNSDSQLIQDALTRAKQAGIRIIVVDTQLKDYPVDTTIVSANYEAGQKIAEHLLTQKQDARILLLTHKGTLSADQRIQGFLDGISSHSEYRVVSERETKGQTELAMPAVLNVLDLGTSIDTIVALNDQAAIGALAALKERQWTEKVLVYGIDGSPDMKGLLASTDDVTATLAQSPVQMGQKVMEVLDLLSRGEQVQEVYTIPVELLDKNNLSADKIQGWQ